MFFVFFAHILSTYRSEKAMGDQVTGQGYLARMLIVEKVAC